MLKHFCYGSGVAATVVALVYGSDGFYVTSSWTLLFAAVHMLGDGLPFAEGWRAYAKGLTGEAKDRSDRRIIKINVRFLLLSGFIMMVTGAWKFRGQGEIGDTVLSYAIIEAVCNLVQVLCVFAVGHQHSDDARESLIVHMAMDLLASLVVIAVALAVTEYGWMKSDAIGTFAVGVLTVWAAVRCKKHDHSNHGPDSHAKPGRHSSGYRHHDHGHGHGHHHRSSHPVGEGLKPYDRSIYHENF